MGSRVNIYINFCLQVHFKVSAAWYCFHYLPPGEWHWWQICHRCQQHKHNWWQKLPPVLLIPVANLPPVSLIPAPILPQMSLTPVGAPWLVYICELLKKLEMTQVLFSGAWGRWFVKKTWSKKSCDTVPFRKGSKYICLQNLGSKLLFGTDLDRNRELEKPPGVELFPCRRKPLRCTRSLRDPAQTQVWSQQVWLNTTFISQGSRSWGKLAVET